MIPPVSLTDPNSTYVEAVRLPSGLAAFKASGVAMKNIFCELFGLVPEDKPFDPLFAEAHFQSKADQSVKKEPSAPSKGLDIGT